MSDLRTTAEAVRQWARAATEYLPELAQLTERDGALWLPVPGPHFSGEPQWAGWVGVLAPAQAEWHAALTARGYKVDVCYGADAMIGALCAYLGVG